MVWNNKAIKILSFSVKLTIVICALWFLYIEIFRNEDIAEIRLYYTKVSNNIYSSFGLFIAVLLMPLNWFLEIKKWQYLVSKIEGVSTINAFKAVFSGITVSAIMPNRMGEFLGRIAYINNADRIKAALITIIGSLSQLTTTIVLGGLSLIILLLETQFELQSIVQISLCIILLGIIIITPILYFNTAIIFTIFNNLKILRRFIKYAQVFKSYSYAELRKTLYYSLGRYLIFTTQFIILLFVFQVEISIFNSLIAIAASFFVIATIPTPALIEIGVREATSLVFIGLFSDNHLGIITATFSLWLINIAVPALIGIGFVFQARFLKSNRS
ncbi:MAG: flippase-like domain-containing protein [Flavobacteriales bacterium]|nr:flippase-like domain-containing protein [Flavobacteriales bacterium]